MALNINGIYFFFFTASHHNLIKIFIKLTNKHNPFESFFFCYSLTIKFVMVVVTYTFEYLRKERMKVSMPGY